MLSFHAGRALARPGRPVPFRGVRPEPPEYTTDTLHALLRGLPDVPSPAVQMRLARRARAGDEEARRELIAGNVRLCYWIARRYTWSGIPLIDLVQEGCLGLIRAADLYDPDRGYAFSTYATHWVRQAVQRGVYNHGRVVRIPVHVHEQLKRMREARAEIEDSGRDATVEEIAERSGLEPARVLELLRTEPEPLSIDAPMSEQFDDSTAWVDSVAAPDDGDTGGDPELARIAARALARLSDREREVLCLRLGLDGGEPLTLEEVGSLIGVTRERVRQIQKAAESRLRNFHELAAAAAAA